MVHELLAVYKARRQTRALASVDPRILCLCEGEKRMTAVNTRRPYGPLEIHRLDQAEAHGSGRSSTRRRGTVCVGTFLLAAPVALALVLPDSFSAGRTAVVTGAAAGLGRAAALKCASLGMNVCLVDCDETRLAEAAVMVAKAASKGDAAVMSQCVDVSDRECVVQLCADVYDRFGEVGVLLSNAGAGTGASSALGEHERWARGLDVNLLSCLHVLQAFVPRMLAQKTVCTVVTTGSKQGITAPPGDLAYNVAKAGVKVITEGLQHELRGSAENEGRVQAHLFVPGFVYATEGSNPSLADPPPIAEPSTRSATRTCAPYFGQQH